MSAFAAPNTGVTTGSITITNAAKGETYVIYKLFDATVDDSDTSKVAYYGTIPAALTDYFEYTAAAYTTANEGYIKAKDGAWDGDEMSAGLKAALATWVASADEADEKIAQGGALEFTGLALGYYVVTTTQGEQAISVDTTNTDVEIVDKNTTEPTIQKKVKNAAGEWVEVTDADIGQAKEFKLDITTTTWHQPLNSQGQLEGEQKQVKSYTIDDNFAANKFELVSIDSIQVGSITEGTFTPYAENGTITVASGATFPVTVAWVDNNGNSIYPNGAVIRIIYKAKLEDDAIIDVGNTDVDKRGNENVADLDWTYTDDAPHFGEDHDHLHDEAYVDTYAIGLKKFDKTGTALANATFQFPFYVKATPADDGAYVYAGEEAGEGLTNTITTPADGQITIKGVKAGEITGIVETQAPDGYNKVATPFSVTATKISTTTTITESEKSWKIDQNGNVTDLVESDPVTVTKTTYTNEAIAVTAIPVINLAGAELPSTGGIGTTLFYVGGGILVLAAVILLVTKRRMGAND